MVSTVNAEVLPLASADAPTQAQLQAAARFAAHHGRNWKHKLRSLWLDGVPRRYGVFGDDAALLQQLRNQLGPAWLRKVSAANLFKSAGVTKPAVFVVGSAESDICLGWIARAQELGVKVTSSGPLAFGNFKHLARDGAGNSVHFVQNASAGRYLVVDGFDESQMRIVALLQQTGVLYPK